MKERNKQIIAVVDELIEAMQPKPGWNWPTDSIKKGAHQFELKDGRIAQVHILIETDESEFFELSN